MAYYLCKEKRCARNWQFQALFEMPVLSALSTKKMAIHWQVGVFRGFKRLWSCNGKAILPFLQGFSTPIFRKPPNINDLAVCERRKPPPTALAAPTALKRLGNCRPSM